MRVTGGRREAGALAHAVGRARLHVLERGEGALRARVAREGLHSIVKGSTAARRVCGVPWPSRHACRAATYYNSIVASSRRAMVL